MSINKTFVSFFLQCGFFKREKRKQVEDFKRKSRYSMRKSRMASVRGQKAGGAGSVHAPMLGDQDIPKKFDEMDDHHFTTWDERNCSWKQKSFAGKDKSSSIQGLHRMRENPLSDKICMLLHSTMIVASIP